jgi:hypothetical protein
VLATASAFAGGMRAIAVADAARRALADAELDGGAIARLIAAPIDAEAVRGLDIAAPVDDSLLAPGTLGAAPLVAAARWLASTDGAFALVVAGDPEGAGAAAVLAPASA